MEAPRESWFSPKIEVRASRVHGKGTFALAVVEPGEVVEIWGEWWKGIKTLEYTNNPEKAEAARSYGKVVMQWDDGSSASRSVEAMTATSLTTPATGICGFVMLSLWRSVPGSK